MHSVGPSGTDAHSSNWGRDAASASALATTYVAYAVGLGGSADFGPYPNAKAKPGSASNSYLRVDGPAVWIEFLVKSEDGTAATNVYYNSIWRDKLADYGGQF